MEGGEGGDGGSSADIFGQDANLLCGGIVDLQVCILLEHASR